MRLLFSTPKRYNPVSALVRWFSKSTVSHVSFFYFDHEWDMGLVMEAHELGFRLIPYSRFERENNIVASITPAVEMNDGLRWAAAWLGTAYDFTGLFGMTWVLLGRIFRMKWNNPWQNSHAMFCSEMAVTVLQKAGLPGVEKLVATDTTPQDLLDFLQKPSGL